MLRAAWQDRLGRRHPGPPPLLDRFARVAGDARLPRALPADISRRMATDDRIYHICRRDEWIASQAAGRYAGSSQDKADGFIHFSNARQVVGSAAKHRAGQSGLVILEVDARVLGPALRWEPSRDGALFPHLYGELPAAAVLRFADLPLGPDGRHVF